MTCRQVPAEPRPCDQSPIASSAVGEAVPGVSYVKPRGCPVWGAQNMPFDGGGPVTAEVGLALGLDREVIMQGRLKGCRLRGREEKGHKAPLCVREVTSSRPRQAQAVITHEKGASSVTGLPSGHVWT